MANSRSALSESQSKSRVMLYVGIGNVNTRPDASPSVMTSMYARLIMAISTVRSPYVKSTGSPPTRGTSSRRSSGQVQSKVRLVNGVCVPQRDGTLRLCTSSCTSCRTSSYPKPSVRTNGAI